MRPKLLIETCHVMGWSDHVMGWLAGRQAASHKSLSIPDLMYHSQQIGKENDDASSFCDAI